MKPIPLESTIKNSIRRRLLDMGCWLRKTSPGPFGYQPGTLDFIGIYRGRGFCLEVKRPGPKHLDYLDRVSHLSAARTLPECPHCWNACTPAQRYEIAAVRRAGGIAHVVTSADEAEFVLSCENTTQKTGWKFIADPT